MDYSKNFTNYDLEHQICTIADYDGIILYVNKNFIKISEYEITEIIGKRYNIIRDATPQQSYIDFWNKLKNNTVWHGIFENKNKYGIPFIIMTKVEPILINGDTYFKQVSTDFTDYFKSYGAKIKTTFTNISELENRDAMMHFLMQLNTTESYNSVALLDIDNFKSINVYYGYEVGYNVIQILSTKILELIEDTSIRLFHISIDKFMLVSFNADDLTPLCYKIIDLIDNEIYNIFTICKLTYSMSIGLSGGYKVLNTIKEADIALAYAKKRTESIVDFRLEKHLQENFELQQYCYDTIKYAITNHTIDIWIQPIIDVKSNKIKKYETLMRIRDKDNAIITADRFIDIAKASKQYRKLSYIMINKTLKYFKKSDVYFNINVSLEDVKSQKTINMIMEHLTLTPELGKRLTIELVEDESIENFTEIQTFIDNLKKFDVKIALDHFGRKCLNFIYLEKIQADFIKIDGTLIQSMMHHKNTTFIVDSIIKIAKKFGMKTVAEFVTSEDILKKVIKMGIDEAQGFYIGEPKPVD